MSHAKQITRTRRLFTAVALALASAATSPAWAGSVSAAKSRVTQAQDYAEHDRKDEAKDKLDEAEKFLDGLTDAEKAPIQKSITDLRKQLGGDKPKKDDTAKTGTGNTTATPTGKMKSEHAQLIERNITRFLTFGEQEMSGNARNAEQYIENAKRALDADDAKAELDADTLKALKARADDLTAKMNAAVMGAEAKQFYDKVDSSIRAGADGQSGEFAARRFDDAHRWLDSDEGKKLLDAAAMKRLRDALTSAEAKVGNMGKKDALDRATPHLKELEEALAKNPFKDLAQYDAYKVSSHLTSLMTRAKDQLEKLPTEDADRKAYEARLAAAQKKIDAYDAAWSGAKTAKSFTESWAFTKKDFTDWQSETYAPGTRAFVLPQLPKTEKVIRQTRYWLADKDTVETRKTSKDAPEVTATATEAEKTLADAQAKLDGAFNAWLDAAEKQPRPQGATRFEIGSANEMAHRADEWLAGSKFHDPDVARAKKLDQRWKDEIAAREAQFAAALQKLTTDADAAWPGIVAGIKPQEGFHPADAASLKGKTFVFKAVRNRTGWDFDSQYDLVMWIDDQPVAGHYDPKVRQAFNDASQKIGDSVNDHEDWDVVAIIEGTGSANHRYTTEVLAKDRAVIGKIEGTKPVDCTLVRVIAVHAGPVAVGP